jgi:hypothetical protein
MKEKNYFKIPEIIIKNLYLEISHQEEELLSLWLNDADKNKQLYKDLEEHNKVLSKYKDYTMIKDELAWKQINAKLQSNETVVRSLFSNLLKYAAVIVFPLMIASFFYYQYNVNKEYTLAEIMLEENPLELQEVTIVLDNGRLINLKEVNTDTLAKLSGAQIINNKTLSFNNKEIAKLDFLNRFITLIIPQAHVQQTILPDGTKVWVNASSSLQHPVLFNDSIRKVKLVGEAYFEVTKNENKPFIVSVNGMDVRVLGTEFNITAYKSDDFIETTLVEGSVQVYIGSYKFILKPGEQLQFQQEKDSVIKKKVNTNIYTSWIEGKYIFEYETLDNVMKKLARWYNVEVFYDNISAKKLHFSGTLNKYDTINKTLHIIEIATKIKFDITDTTVLIKENKRKK